MTVSMPIESGLHEPSFEAALATAQSLVREGRMTEAGHAFQAVLAQQPEQKEALRFFARVAMARGAAGEAVDWLNRAAAVDRDDTDVLLELGVAYRIVERFDASRYVFERALELSDGRDTTTRLLLANVLELDQRPELALTHYFRAILDAQLVGRWLDDDTTQLAIRGLVRHAMAYVFEGRRALFNNAVRPFRDPSNPVAMARLDRALAIYLRDSDERPLDPQQRPSILYMPGLDTARTLPADRLDWLPGLLETVSRLGAEISTLTFARNVTDSQDAPLPSGGEIQRGDAEAGETTASDRRIPIYLRGAPTDAAVRGAPNLLAALAATPLARVRSHSPEVEILVLAAGRQLVTPCGRSNARCWVLLALPGSASVEIRIGGQSHSLGEGGALVVDSSFGMATVNRVNREARILAFEIWHPELSPIERDALTALTTAIVEFDTRLELA